jgi:hypothetical protein
MRALLLIGLIVLILGLVSLVVPIPSTERTGVKAGGISLGVETQHEEKVSPLVSAVLILGGAGMMIAGKVKG